MNQSIHTVDSLLYLAGPAKRVTANTTCLAHERIEVEDHCVALIEFDNGARGVIEASTCSWSKDGHPARVQLLARRVLSFSLTRPLRSGTSKTNKPKMPKYSAP